MKRLLPAVGITLCLTACLGDPVGPHGTLVLVRVGGSPSDSLLIGAPGRILPQLLQFRLIDGDGRPVPAATVTWSVETGNGRIEDAATTTAQDGTLGARWLLGTKAGDSQQFEVMAREGSHVATAKLKAIPVPVEVASLKILTDTAVRVGVAALVHAEATDPFGNRFVPKGLRFATLDTTLAVVDSAGDLRALRRGFARLTATASGVSDTALVHGIQIVKAIQVDRDTVSYHSLGQGQAVKVTLVDDQGQPVPDSFPSVAPSDTGIIEI